MTLILVGYMGSGKSSVGQGLSKILKYDFIDLDHYIENKVGFDIKTIFKTKGEIFFRKLEAQCLQETIKKVNTVIAVGGGTPCYGNNLSNIKNQKDCMLIYLKSSIGNLADRLLSELEKRPLISHLESKEELSEFIGKHLFERAPFYEQSDLVIKTDQLSVAEVIELTMLKLF